ncbi:phage protease [Campylobacter sp. 9BO]|uniref:phage protease n=1 Tax=Campylobacter sp. 9BO TaxID=3424759 RepID=UPI003D341DE3
MQGVRLKSVLNLNFKDDEKLKVSPIGEVVGLDGRGFEIDGEVLLKSIAKNALHIPLDENHSFGEALGWFDKDSFELREDGVYARLELTSKGKELVENRSYRYLSPVYDISGKNVTALDSVGLVNRPNLLNNTLNHKGEDMQKELQELKAQNEALQKELSELKAANEAKKQDEQNEQNNDQNLAKQDEQTKELNSKFDSFSERLDKIESTIKAVFGRMDANKSENLKELSSEQKRVANMLGMSEEEYKNTLEGK